MGTKKFVSVSYNKIFEEIANPLLDAVAFAVGANKDIPTEIIKWINSPQSVTASDMRAFFSFGKNTLNMLPVETSKYQKIIADIDENRQIVSDFTGYAFNEITNLGLNSYPTDSINTIATAVLSARYNYSPFTKTMDMDAFFADFPAGRGEITRTNYTDFDITVTSTNANIEFDDDNGDEDSEIIVYLRGVRISDGYVTTARYRIRYDFYRLNQRSQPKTEVIDRATFLYRGNYESVTFLRSSSILKFTTDSSGSGDSTLEFYPWIPLIRKFKKVEPSNTDPNVYADLTALSNTVNLPHEQLVGSLPLRLNSDTVIDDSSVFCSIDLCTKDVDALQYLFDYFLDYYPSLATNEPLPNDIKLRPKEVTGALADYFSQFSFEDLIIRTVNESLESTNRNGGFNIRYTERTETDDEGDESIVSYSYHLEKSNGDGTYTSIEVIEPRYYTYVVRRRGQAAGQRQLYDAIVRDNANSSQCNIRMFIARQRLEKYTAKVQSGIATHSFGIETGTYTEIDQPWYANPLVQFALQVFAIVVTILTLDFSGGFAALVFSAIELAAINYVFRLIIEKLAPGEIGALLVAVAIATGTGLREITGYLRNVITDPTALLDAINAVTNIANLYTDVQQQLLAGEQEEFNEDLQAAQKKIKDYYDSVEGPLEELNPFFEGVATKDVIVIESPTEFFFRTTHVGNVGVQSLDFAASYVDNSLRLDSNKFEDTDFIIV